jgi:hypothetical protein
MSPHFSTHSFCWQSALFLLLLISAVATTAPVLGQQDSDTNDAGVDVSEWILMRPTGADAEFLMPVKPRYQERTFTPVQSQPPIRVRQHQATSPDGKSSFVFGYHDLHKKPTSREVVTAIDGAIAGSVVRLSGKLLSNERIEGAYPGKQFSYLFSNQGKFFKVSARVFLADRRQYFLQAIFEQDAFDQAVADRFLDSFRIVKPDSDLPPRPPIPPKKGG